MAIDFKNSEVKHANWLRGKVVDNDDPKKEGRVRLMVEPLWGDLDTDEIPWAMPAKEQFQGSSGEDFGSFSVPKVGSWVHFEFENGEPEKMIYKKDAYFEGSNPDRFKGNEDQAYDDIESNLIGDEPSTNISDYPESAGFITEAGIVFEYSDEPRILIFHPSGFRFEILSEGDHVKHVEGNNYKKVQKDDIITTNGNKTEEVKGDRKDEVSGEMEQTVSKERLVEAGNGATLRMKSGRIYLN